jgi:hypothetical protein
MSLRASLLAAVAVVLLRPPDASADPRWFWNDARVAETGSVSVLDLDVVPGDPPAVFIAWVEPPTLIEGRLQLIASFDGGCSFCPPTHVESLFGATDDLSLAVAELPARGSYSIQVLHAAGSGELQVLHDASSVPLSGTVAEKCAALLEVNANRRATVLSGTRADRPDLAAGTDASGGSVFHAVWRQTDGLGSQEVFHARDLAGDGTSWEVLGSLFPSIGGGEVGEVRVTIDALADAPGPHAVNVAWTRPLAGEVLYLRSTDAGTTFSATGAPPASQPQAVNVAIPGHGTGALALDTGAPPDPASPTWLGAFWYQERELPVFLDFAGKFQPDPTAPRSWSPQRSVTGGGFARDEGLAAAVFPGGFGGSPAPVFLAWTDMPGLAGSEIFVRGGRLDGDLDPGVDLDTFPFAPVRPLDTSVSTNGQLSACAHDEATGACTPTRTRGRAHRPAADDDGTDVHVAWIDDRTGAPQPWYTRSDQEVAPPAPSLAVSCPTPATRRVTVTFPQVATCRSSPLAAEKLLRYLVYYGQVAGGPYENTDLGGTDPGVPDTIVVVDDGTLPDPVTVDIDGLLAGVIYRVVVVPEDDARNVFPPDFDPTVGRGASPPNERAVTTPVDCSAPVRCLYRATAPTLDSTGLFVSPRGANDVAFASPGDVAHACPFASGDADPERVLDPGAPPLVFYQVDGADVTGLRVALDRPAATVRITY